MTATPSFSQRITVRDLGVPVKAVNWIRLHPGRGADGQPSLLATMGQNNGGLFVLDIDLATGRCRQFNAPAPLQQYPISAIRSPSTGILYIGSHTDGHLLRYDATQPERGLEDLGVIDGDQAIFPTGIAESPDGQLWIGGYPGCGLTRYNPATGEFTRYGSLDPEDKYLYPHIGCDGTVAALTKFVHPHLVVLDPATGERKTVGPVINPEDKAQRIHFFKGLDGRLYLDTHEGKFRLSGTTLEPVTFLPPELPGVHATHKHAYQEALPMPGGLTAWWEDGDEGAGLYRKIRLTGSNPTIPPRVIELDWQGAGTNLFVLHLGSDQNLYGSSFLPEHLFRYTPASDDMVNLGRCSLMMGEAYALGNFSDGTMIITSYPKSHISLYDPRQPYRFGTDAAANPRDIGRLDEIGIRPVGLAITPPLTAPDGQTIPERAWVGSLPDYGLWGGTLAWLDPKTGEHRSHRNLVPDCAPVSILYLPGPRQLLIGMSTESGTGTKIRAKTGALVLWDPVADRALYAGDFGIADLGSVQALAPAPGGLVYALLANNRFAEDTMGAPKLHPRLALLDPAARRAVAVAPFAADLMPAALHTQFTIFPGPDGIYGITEKTLYRLKPGTCETEVVWRAPGGDQLDVPGPWIGRTFHFATGWRLRSLTLP
ncbi:MAG: hypothetical protein IT582_01220 [Opitutaceae bacterium]|nr:hypothetical protein [Opitutaceae bacterium]